KAPGPTTRQLLCYKRQLFLWRLRYDRHHSAGSSVGAWGLALLAQVVDRWVYSACLCFALNHEHQKRSAFTTPIPVLVLGLVIIPLAGGTAQEQSAYERALTRRLATLECRGFGERSEGGFLYSGV